MAVLHIIRITILHIIYLRTCEVDRAAGIVVVVGDVNGGVGLRQGAQFGCTAIDRIGVSNYCDTSCSPIMIPGHEVGPDDVRNRRLRASRCRHLRLRGQTATEVHHLIGIVVVCGPRPVHCSPSKEQEQSE